jgi:hypothetical protein
MVRGISIVLLASTLLLAVGCGPIAYDPTDALPAATTEGGFATSDSCRACHPGQYKSWHDSFHRTMTQVASRQSILGDFDDVTLEGRGHATRLERRGETHWVDTPDPAWFMDPDPQKIAAPPRIESPVVMTTGSHHMQYYWIRRPTEGVLHGRPDHGALVSIPWVWMIEEARWIPTQDSFLTPPNPAAEPPRWWNNSCFQCHSVGTQPQYSSERDEFASRSVELGIACEACHGPAEEHIRANRSPLARYAKYFRSGDEGDDTIVNPARLDAARSRDVCGQCHSVGEPLDFETYTVTGVAYRPGDRLDATVHSYRHAPDEAPSGDAPTLVQHGFGNDFWADGTIRVAGREYNGLLKTECATRGELTCLTCHSLHDYQEPKDQLSNQVDSDSACLDCHAAIGSAVTEHTHHPVDSAGSSCMNCHMPHTTYGLFTAMRSHRIDSPSAAVHAETGRPNACNLCHLDQTLAWTNERLHAWYGQPRIELGPDDRTLASSVLLATQGNAVQRGLVGWHMAWEPARKASGEEWVGAYLSLLLADPYVAVRRVADRSIAQLPGFEGFEYDFMAAPEKRSSAKRSRAGRDRWWAHRIETADICYRTREAR